jgi:hypothetical protein
MIYLLAINVCFHFIHKKKSLWLDIGLLLDRLGDEIRCVRETTTKRCRSGEKDE